jgi:hypothetical protein
LNTSGILLSLALLAAAVGCSRVPDPVPRGETTLRPAEKELVDLYLELEQAERAYHRDPVEGEKAFRVLEGEWTEARLESLMSRVGERPERWYLVFREIERRREGAGRGRARPRERP